MQKLVRNILPGMSIAFVSPYMFDLVFSERAARVKFDGIRDMVMDIYRTWNVSSQEEVYFQDLCSVTQTSSPRRMALSRADRPWNHGSLVIL